MLGAPGSGGAPQAASAQGKVSEARWAAVVTSAPFVSVNDAVDHLEGSGDRRLPVHQSSLHSCSQDSHCMDVILTNLKEQTRQLEKDLIVKQQETLEVLKELEKTKGILDGLKLMVQGESSEATVLSDKKADSIEMHPVMETEEHGSQNLNNLDQAMGPQPSPGLTLMELKQAKLNLNRATCDLAGIQASVEEFKSELEKEKFSIEKTHEKIALNTVHISSLERELSQSRLMLQLVKDSGLKKGTTKPPHISRKFYKLRSEAEQFRRMGAASESKVQLIEEVARNKSGIKTLEIREVGTRKVEAASTMKMVTLANVKALTNSQNPDTSPQHSCGVTITVEGCNMLAQKAQEAERVSSQVDEANKTKMELSKKVEEANLEIKNSRKALSEALSRVEAANNGKLAVDEALRKWRSEQGQRRCSVRSSPRSKNPSQSLHRKDSTKDTSGLNSVTDTPKSVLRPALSIGQILGRKLLWPEEMEAGNSDSIIERSNLSPKISLGQMLSRRHWSSPENKDLSAPRKSFDVKKKELGFVGNFSLITTKHKRKNRKKKKRQACSPR